MVLEKICGFVIILFFVGIELVFVFFEVCLFWDKIDKCFGLIVNFFIFKKVIIKKNLIVYGYVKFCLFCSCFR